MAKSKKLKPVKFDRVFISRILELYTLGYTKTEISSLLQFNPASLSRFLKNNPEVAEKMEEMKEERMRGIIERGLSTLATGTEVEEESITKYTVDDLGDKVKVVSSVRKLPPNVKAIEVLARKYENIFSTNELKQINNLIMTENPISMRELLDYKKSQENPLNVIEVEGEEYEPSDDRGSYGDD